MRYEAKGQIKQISLGVRYIYFRLFLGSGRPIIFMTGRPFFVLEAMTGQLWRSDRACGSMLQHERTHELIHGFIKILFCLGDDLEHI